MHFLEWKLSNFNANFTEIYSSWSNQQQGSIGSANAFVPKRQQAITWTNNDQFYWWRVNQPQFVGQLEVTSSLYLVDLLSGILIWKIWILMFEINTIIAVISILNAWSHVYD